MKRSLAPLGMTRKALLVMAGTLVAGAAFAADHGFVPKKDALPEFLPVDEAFEIEPLVIRKDGRLEVSWRIAKGYYLYRDRLKFAAAKPASLRLDAPLLPKSESHEDEHFGTMQVYRDRLVVELPAGAPKGPVSITVGYQGCADAGLCYPPQTRMLEAGH